MGAPQIPEDRIELIKRDLLGRGESWTSFRGLAKRHQVSETSVRKIARDLGVASFPNLNFPHARAMIETSREIWAQQRAELAALMLVRARSALDDMVRPAVIYNFGGKDNTYAEHAVSRPPVVDQRGLMTIAAIAVDKHRAIVDFDQNGASAPTRGLLDALADEILQRHGGGPPAPHVGSMPGEYVPDETDTDVTGADGAK